MGSGAAAAQYSISFSHATTCKSCIIQIISGLYLFIDTDFLSQKNATQKSKDGHEGVFFNGGLLGGFKSKYQK